jgi:predicted nucleic acid-binding protein
MFILDTNVVSELRKAKAGKADVNVTKWAGSVPAESLYLCAITLLELEIGILKIERRDSKQGTVLRAWLETHVLPAFEGRILAIDTPVARPYAVLQAPRIARRAWS